MHSLRALRLEPGGDSDGDSMPDGAPNLIGGSPWNSVADGVVGSVIMGGGATNRYGSAQTNTIQSDFCIIGGGVENHIHQNASTSTIGGGSHNVINAFSSTIGGGSGNEIGQEANETIIAGGNNNTIGNGAYWSAILGGSDNVIDAGGAAIGGGSSHYIGRSAYCSVISGGYQNMVCTDAPYATIPGGYDNRATNYAFAAGNHARAIHTGAFVWGDSTEAEVASITNNSVTMRASGGFRFFTGPGGAQLPAGATAWTVMSDRNVKKDFAPVESVAILDKLVAMPVTQWHYQWEDSGTTPHIGPMAQDFKAAFYPGRDDTTISTLEADGVALAAIQGLNLKLENQLKTRDAEIQKLKQEMFDLKALLQQLGRLSGNHEQ